jgi:hypothetical protein
MISLQVVLSVVYQSEVLMEEKVNVTRESLATTSQEAVAAFIKKTHPDIDEIINVLLAKNADYGDAWQRFGIFTPLIRENDKILRVKTLSGGQQALVADENIIDTITDIVGYGLLALLKLKHNSDLSNENLVPEELIIQSLPDVDQAIADDDEGDYDPTFDEQEGLSEIFEPFEPGLP